MQENLRQRDAELADLTSRLHQRDIQVEELHSEISRVKRDHARTVDEQSRKLSEVVAREVEARAAMEQMLRGKVETDVMQGTLKERVEMLQGEVERLRRQVHELQQESADKEVKLTQMSKQRAQDKEDLQGLNIALDSKQQELELVSLPGSKYSLIGFKLIPILTVKEARCDYNRSHLGNYYSCYSFQSALPTRIVYLRDP